MCGKLSLCIYQELFLARSKFIIQMHVFNVAVMITVRQLNYLFVTSSNEDWSKWGFSLFHITALDHEGVEQYSLELKGFIN